MTGLLDVGRQEFSASFAHRPFAVRHHLSDHPLLTVEAVAALADALPASQIEHTLGTVPEVAPGGDVPHLDATPGEVARGIETNGCWMVLRNIETHPDYRRLLDETLDEVVPLVGEQEGPMVLREGFIFLTAPEATTPVHLDPEHNFLLQIRSTKTISIGSYADVGAEQRELERYYTGGHRNLDALPGTRSAFPLAPGDGVYVPVHAPHWVANGPAVSVSLSITFRTPVTRRAELVHTANAWMRSLRLSPAPPGAHPAGDRVKAFAARVGRKLQ